MALLCYTSLAKELYGLVISVTDGDTIRILDSSKTQHKIRLDAIDAPESSQAYGNASKRQLSKMIAGQSVRVSYESLDRYGRILGTVMFNGKNINLEMVKTGYAWHYVQYAKDKTEFAVAEKKARDARLGLWADKGTIIPPWEFRKLKSSGQSKQPQNLFNFIKK